MGTLSASRGKGPKKSYGGFSGGWFADKLHQRDSWQDILIDLDLTEKQKRAAIMVLEFMKAAGQEDSSRALSHDPRSAKWWKSKFVSMNQLKEHFRKASGKEGVSNRYLWYAVEWLMRNGWIDEGRRFERGGSVRGYWLSDRVLKYATRLEALIPTLWEEKE